ncbi:Prosaposin [Manis pentadactyla]|nr:Prosaposin [Manis pentadactyla]
MTQLVSSALREGFTEDSPPPLSKTNQNVPFFPSIPLMSHPQDRANQSTDVTLRSRGVQQKLAQMHKEQLLEKEVDSQRHQDQLLPSQSHLSPMDLNILIKFSLWLKLV